VALSVCVEGVTEIPEHKDPKEVPSERRGKLFRQLKKANSLFLRPHCERVDHLWISNFEGGE